MLAGDDLAAVEHLGGEVAEATDHKANAWGVSAIANRCGQRMLGGLSESMQDRLKTTWGER